MCSGKTTLSTHLRDNLDIHSLSFSDEVYRIAREDYGMKVKDRKLLQEVRKEKCKSDPFYFIDKTLLKAEEIKDRVIIDDMRTELEYKEMAKRKDKWIFIRLLIDRDLQEKLLRDTYKDKCEEHLGRRENYTEIALDNIDLDNFDIVVRNHKIIKIGGNIDKELKDLLERFYE